MGKKRSERERIDRHLAIVLLMIMAPLESGNGTCASFGEVPEADASMVRVRSSSHVGERMAPYDNTYICKTRSSLRSYPKLHAAGYSLLELSVVSQRAH